MSDKRLVTPNMSIAEVMKRFPQTEAIFVRYKLHCVGCEAAPLETIEMAAGTHRLRDLNQLLDDLNRSLS